MSIDQRESVVCPTCQEPIVLDLIYSINADRRPDIREAIFAGTFQSVQCEACEEAVRVEPELTYLDVGRGQWILARPVRDVESWKEGEAYARSFFDVALGADAPLPAQAIGKQLAVRVVFGWVALREKLLCKAHGLDDEVVEMVKFAMLRGLESLPLGKDHELRLMQVTPDKLLFGWLDATDEVPIESLDVPRSLYESICADALAWEPFREQLTAGPFVDYQRMFVDPVEDAA